MNPSSLTLTKDLVWPWSLPGLMLIAMVLVGLTIWTYRGVQGSTNRRVTLVLGLRLAALALACLMILRPSLAYKEELRVPSLLLIALDGSESMSIQDEADSKSRWSVMLQTLRQCEPILQQLHDEQNVNVVVYRFAEDAIPEEHAVPSGQADGKRTDFGKLLHTVTDRHGADKNLRGLIIVSDGADNGTVYPPLTEAGRLRRLPCPVYTFALG
ncbi:MAG TPA: vWA domain-containing protein, partial [Gemmataceae bacterium]|nr:vWA domain-containing protein [Gemmataceae bacterium]